MNKRVVVDMDGVLADFERAFCEKFGYEHRELVHLESRYPSKAREIVEFINDGNVYKNLEPIQFGMQIVEYLTRSGFEVHIVTGRPFGFERLSMEWLKRNKIPYSSFRSNRQKVGEIVDLNPICAVDDLFTVHQSLLFHNIPTIIVSQPWNDYSGENLNRVSYISQFQEVFGRINHERQSLWK